jgi:glycosyltransferase involved in cell wall biosynthesis
MPTYNYAGFLAEAIESVLDQTFEEFELLVIDDCSQDDSRAVIERYARRDPRIAWRVNVSNLGLVHNWNACLRESRGTYVKFLFADDLLASRDALAKLVEVLDSRPDVSLAGSSRHIIDSTGRRLATLSHFRGHPETDGTEVINRCLREWKNFIGEPSAVIFRRSDSARGFNPKYRHLVDLEMWFHLLEKGNFAFLDEPLSSFRVHPRQQTVDNVERLADLEDAFLLLDDYLDKPYVTMGGATRGYVRYDKVYQYWKLYKKRKISRQEAVRRIGERISWERFSLLYPLYKLYKPFYKLKTRVRNRREYGRS